MIEILSTNTLGIIDFDTLQKVTSDEHVDLLLMFLNDCPEELNH